MTFPKAYAGVKKLYTSEFLNILSTVIAFVAYVLAFYLPDNATFDTDPGLFTFMVILAISTVISVIAFIMQVIGLNQARKEEKMFRNAMAFVIVCAICTLLSLFFVGTFGNVAACIDVGATLLVNVYVITGVYVIAYQWQNNAMMLRCKVMMAPIVTVFALALLARVIASAFPEIDHPLSIAQSVLEFIGYIVFLVFLGFSKKMLANQPADA